MSPKPRATPAPQPTDSDIAQRAYQRWTTRGRPPSDGREDWYAAEAELLAERATLAAASQPGTGPAEPNTAPKRRPIRSALRRLGI